MLLNNYKFDIRVYVLITSDGILFLDTDSIYIKSCPIPYQALNNLNLKSHLTNQHYHGIKNQQTLQNINQISSLIYLKEKIINFITNISSTIFILSQIKSKGKYKHLHHCYTLYHLLGLDLIFNNQQQLYLLEINANPDPFDSYQRLIQLTSYALLTPYKLYSMINLYNIPWWINPLKKLGLSNSGINIYISKKLGNKNTYDLHQKLIINYLKQQYQITKINFLQTWDNAHIIWKVRLNQMNLNTLKSLIIINILPNSNNLTNKANLIHTLHALHAGANAGAGAGALKEEEEEGAGAGTGALRKKEEEEVQKEGQKEAKRRRRRIHNTIYIYI